MSKKLLRGVLCAVLIFALLRACGVITVHEHDWQAATCTAPRICSVCDAKDGEPLGHTWSVAACEEPEQCVICGTHRHWYSSDLGHDWELATCTVPKTCARCGLTDGEPYGHNYRAEVSAPATCQAEGVLSHVCTRCGYTETEPIPVVEHSALRWTTIQDVTLTAPGVRARICTMCGEEIEREEWQHPAATTGTASTGTGIGFNTYDNEAQQQTSAQYVLNTRSGKFHRPSCRDVPKISPANYSTTSRSRSDLIAGGWDPCGHCSP